MAITTTHILVAALAPVAAFLLASPVFLQGIPLRTAWRVLRGRKVV